MNFTNENHKKIPYLQIISANVKNLNLSFYFADIKIPKGSH